jgi:uncharacterized membrane protein YjjP (DUF1212 family)
MPTSPTSLHPIPSNADPRVAFILKLGRALHNSGYSAQRLEEALMLASERLGIIGQFFSTPTSIMASFGPQDDQRTFMIRVEPDLSDLGKLARVDRVLLNVVNNELDLATGSTQIDEIEASGPPYGTVTTTIAFGVASACAARFLGGGFHEVVAGLGVGLGTGILALLSTRHPGLEKVFGPVAAFLASALATLVAATIMPISVLLTTLAGVIILIPGLTITTAMTELSTRHLASGTARLMGALVTLMGITFGIAFGNKAVTLALGSPVLVDPAILPQWTLWLALLIAPFGFAVLLRAEPRDMIWILLAGILAFFGASVGAQFLGSELGAFGGALLTGIGSQIYSRITNRPSQITLVPGLLLLVPGSIGLRSFTSMMDQDVLLGVDGIFKMALIAVSLVSGILIARIVSPRRALLD